MRDPTLDAALEPEFDPDVTVTIPVPRRESKMARARSVDALSPSERTTPVLPYSYPCLAELRATLTVLTGEFAGRLVTMDGTPVTIGRAQDADLRVEDSGVSRHHVRIARATKGTFYAEDLCSTNGTFIRTDRIGVALLHGGDLLELGPNVRVSFAVDDPNTESLEEVPDDTSVYDPLTRVFDRNYLDGRLLAEIAHAQHANGDVVVLMIGVDGLDEVNEHFGHLAGDRVLCAIVTRIQRMLHEEDVLARYEGDKFVVLAVGTAGAEAWHLAERVRRAVEALHLSARGRDVHITASIGVASLKELESSDGPVVALLAASKARMCGAKASGGNSVSNVDPHRVRHAATY